MHATHMRVVRVSMITYIHMGGGCVYDDIHTYDEIHTYGGYVALPACIDIET